MSRAKVSMRAEGRVDTSKFGDQHNVDIDASELKELISETSFEDGCSLTRDVTKPYKGAYDEYVWDQDAIQPKFLDMCTKLIRSIFGIKKEVDRFTYKIFPPAKKVSKKSVEIKRLNMSNITSAGGRIFITVGSDEVLIITASGGGQKGTGKILLSRTKKGNALMIPFMLTLGADITWDNNDTSPALEPPKRGAMSGSIRKFPKSRYMIVIDCIGNTEIVTKTLASVAGIDLSANKEEVPDSSIDACAAAAAVGRVSSTSEVVEDDDDDISQIAQLASKPSEDILETARNTLD
jgi:hypothetical protein